MQNYNIFEAVKLLQKCAGVVCRFPLCDAAVTCFDICHQIAPLQELFSVTFTYIFMFKIAK